MADFLAAFGLRLFDKLTYPIYVGLMLNLPRILMRDVYAGMQAIRAANAPELPLELFDAVASSDEHAADLAMDANMQMSQQRAAQAALRMMNQ